MAYNCKLNIFKLNSRKVNVGFVMLFLAACFVFYFLSGCQIFRGTNNNSTFTQKGILFLSANNPEYIDSLKYKDELNILYLRDIFLPVKDFDSTKSLQNKFFEDNLGKGVELGYFKERMKFDSSALQLFTDSVASLCYMESRFSIIPVLITYRKLSDYPKTVNCGNLFTLWLGKRKVHVSYETYSIELLKIEVYH